MRALCHIICALAGVAFAWLAVVGFNAVDASPAKPVSVVYRYFV